MRGRSHFSRSETAAISRAIGGGRARSSAIDGSGLHRLGHGRQLVPSMVSGRDGRNQERSARGVDVPPMASVVSGPRRIVEAASRWYRLNQHPAGKPSDVCHLRPLRPWVFQQTTDTRGALA